MSLKTHCVSWRKKRAWEKKEGGGNWQAAPE